ncbi:MAG TPA: 23S rRNA (adenine(2503)-C(2))-methyltransferase RlmN, partial [Beijerinckiaceae bacterium]|nr:23S rRNA (adenine(2503)-C(2))-methyltransferase RlmN [Beijerinckiaceae bacterium]
MSLAELHPSAPQAPTPAAKPSLVGMTRGELAAAFAAIGVSDREIRMRVAQLWHWIYFQGATSFDAPTNIGKALRT